MANGLFKLKGPKMLKGDHAPNFPLKHAQKDALRAPVRRTGTPSPLAAAANAAFLAQRRTTATTTSRPPSGYVQCLMFTGLKSEVLQQSRFQISLQARPLQPSRL